jgi:hypothetical protein
MAVENDIVLVYHEGIPLTYARIESIDPDIKRGWYHVKLLLLQLPLQVVTWILRDVYVDGETFTMGGKEMRLEKVECPPDPDADVEPDEKKKPAGGDAKVISLSDMKKK